MSKSRKMPVFIVEPVEPDKPPKPRKKKLLGEFKAIHGLWRDRPPVPTRQISLAPTIPDSIVDMFLDIKLIPQSTEELRHQELTPNESINVLNYMMETIGSDIRWDPDLLSLNAKLRSEPNYAARTGDFTIDKLRSLINLLNKWINDSLFTRRVNKILVVDFMNLFYFGPIASIKPDTIKYKIIEYMLKRLILEDGYNRIIICVQNNELLKSEFTELMIKLHQFFGYIPKTVLIMPGHNRSSMDDFFVVLCCALLKKVNLLIKSGVLTGDMYADFVKEQMFKIFIKIYYEKIESDIQDFGRYDEASKEIVLRQMMESKIKYLKSVGYEFTPENVFTRVIYPTRSSGSISSRVLERSGPSSRGSSSRGISSHRGGTIKYKKSLLNKRTRKIYKKNYSQKMKKYSKNKKKKTLRRRL